MSGAGPAPGAPSARARPGPPLPGGGRRDAAGFGLAEVALGVAALALTLGLAELGARLWIARQWPPEMREQLTHETATRGRFTADPVLGYALTPGYRGGGRTHNRAGFRGPELRPRDPGGARLVLMGASTVYGARVDDPDTAARRLEGLLAERLAPRPVEVVNAGVPGWTSAETVLNLEHRVLALEPDAVVVMDGRNEVFPQLFRHYRDDYGHFRAADVDIRRTHAAHKAVFRVSHLALLLATAGPGHFGFHIERENPVYATIRWENQPTAEEAVRHAAEPERTRGYRQNLEREVALARAHGVLPVLVTIPFRAQAFRSGVLPREETLLDAIGALVARNNEIVRETARATGALLVDAAPQLATKTYLADDCHFNPAGERAFAGVLADALAAPLAARLEIRRRGDGGAPGRASAAPGGP